MILCSLMPLWLNVCTVVVMTVIHRIRRAGWRSYSNGWLLSALDLRNLILLTTIHLSSLNWTKRYLLWVTFFLPSSFFSWTSIFYPWTFILLLTLSPILLLLFPLYLFIYLFTSSFNFSNFHYCYSLSLFTHIFRLRKCKNSVSKCLEQQMLMSNGNWKTNMTHEQQPLWRI